MKRYLLVVWHSDRSAWSWRRADGSGGGEDARSGREPDRRTLIYPAAGRRTCSSWTPLTSSRR